LTEPTPVPIGDDAPYCEGPQAELRSPQTRMMPGSCDTHMHICGPGSEFPYDGRRIYTPPDALVPAYIQVMNSLGIERVVLVQPSIYGADNRVLLKAMIDLSAAGYASRAVAVVGFDVRDEQLQTLDRAGVRGLRYNLVDVADPTVGAPIEKIRWIAERIARLGWHVEFLAHVDDYPDLVSIFRDFPTDIVFGHVGYVRIGKTTEDAGFQAMLELASMGKCWIKVTAPYRISAGAIPYSDAEGFVRSAVNAAPDRIVWGTDWPHVKISKPMPHDADMCDSFYDWVTDEGMRKRILVDNPTQLYGF